MSEWIEIYINGEHSHDREIKFLPLNKLRLTHEVQYQMRGEKKT